ncbi:P-loop NTPase fold protein [Virgibacillus sp. C22-A2]|uniref:P-loop NTPase fold protein n=1 Tax=Virgibacillus tibetensis TaxID=3042313 RepID=A0ABU6KC63_9BACI|nr:P-loop NTPase fold protein [Virgibacillus sp. C22-A2]
MKSLKFYLAQVIRYYSTAQILKLSVIVTSVFLLIDVLNLFSKLLLSYDVMIVLIVTSAIIIFLILTVLEFNIYEVIKIETINLLDVFAITVFISASLYLCLFTIFPIYNSYKLLILIILLVTMSVILIFRINKMNLSYKKATEYESNFIDLKNIYNGDFKIKDGETIVVNEKDVDYDLFERHSVISLLYNTIKQSNPNEGFVISLEGEWGSGKTTIINNTKKLLNQYDEEIVLIDFDPWAFSNQESLLLGLFDEIIRKSGLNYSLISTNQMAQTFSTNIFGNGKANIIKSFFKQKDSNEVIKNKINDYLNHSGKKFVFFIDNIDRAESKNILLLFKLVATVFNFERVIYVLSFDSERVKEVFEKNHDIDFSYLKKVIQMQIRVPKLDREIFNNVLAKSFINLLSGYGANNEEINNYKSVVNSICNQTTDMRDFKRFINSILNRPITYLKYLDKRDLMAIEYIHLNNPALYEKINQNRIFFISHDKRFDKGTYSTIFNNKEINSKGKEFFDKLFEGEVNEQYKEILKEIFPYVKKYCDNQSLEYDGIIVNDDHQYKDIGKNRRVCSGKYFDLYFTYSSNEFVAIGEMVEKIISTLYESYEFSEKLKAFNSLIEPMHFSYQKELLERLQLYTDSLDSNSAFDLALILFNNIDKFDDSPGFFSLSTQSRGEIILWELLQRIDDKSYEEFLIIIRKKYNIISNVGGILYWFNHDREGKNIEGRMEMMEEIHQSMANEIIDDSINIFDEKYYSHRNIWGLYHVIDEKGKVKDFIRKNIDDNNIFKLLYDITGISVGTKITYYIKAESLNFLTTEEEVDDILKNVKNFSEDQKFIYDVYQAYKNKIRDDWGDLAISTNEILTLNP